MFFLNKDVKDTKDIRYIREISVRLKTYPFGVITQIQQILTKKIFPILSICRPVGVVFSPLHRSAVDWEDWEDEKDSSDLC